MPEIYHFLVRHRTSKSRHLARGVFEYGDDLRRCRKAGIPESWMSNL